ncbi:uncharacterized protein RSE6_01218 [Rhynchosporium secalis]|uniref:Uncharacterized protein n=1 Tax=Rhynchosporium secalis TaxID=38038 RepID=A0A1E1LX94_RHYSE|nr:uncharacterized protein RSE6_01218 [Rhynchosporium secalis]
MLTQNLDIFKSAAVGGTKTAPYTYIRKNTNGNSPVTDLTSKELTWNVGGETGGSTTTVSVAAVSVYMAMAPTTAADFDGSGDIWFKIRDIEPTFPGGVWDLKQTYDVMWLFLGAFEATDSGYTANIYNNVSPWRGINEKKFYNPQ